MSQLAQKAMLVTLSISAWTAKRHDKTVSKEVATSHHIKETVGRYNKRLLPENADSYNSVITAANAARATHYDQTLPWTDAGARILTAANFMPYAELMRHHRYAFDAAVESFIAEYPTLRNRARTELNGMFKDADYPADWDIKSKFGFRQATMPLPDATDFRVSLNDEDILRIRQEIEQNTTLACEDAMKDAWQRLNKGLANMVERLSEPDKIFRDTLFTNLGEMCEILPRLNLFNNSALDVATEDIRRKILAYTPEQARTSVTARQAIAAEADRIAKSMQGYL